MRLIHSIFAIQHESITYKTYVQSIHTGKTHQSLSLEPFQLFPVAVHPFYQEQEKPKPDSQEISIRNEIVYQQNEPNKTNRTKQKKPSAICYRFVAPLFSIPKNRKKKSKLKHYKIGSAQKQHTRTTTKISDCLFVFISIMGCK